MLTHRRLSHNPGFRSLGKRIVLIDGYKTSVPLKIQNDCSFLDCHHTEYISLIHHI